MKTKFLFLALFVSLLSISQNNRSNGTVTGNFTGAVPAQFSTPGGTTEAFRFRSGLVTQLDSGTAFDFATSSQWFSLGRLTPTSTSQTLYGFRIQRAGRGLVMGYSGANQTATGAPTTPGNPFIQWVGNSPTITSGDLEFRTSSNSNNSTTDRLAFTLRSNLTALLGESSAFVAAQPPFQINKFFLPKLDVSSRGNPGIFVDVNDGINFENFGVKTVITSPDNAAENNYGVLSFVNSSTQANSVNIGVFGSSTGTQSSISGPIGPIGNYAGYFAGTVFATQGLFGSDERLKKDIRKETKTLEKLNLINPVIYNFEQNQNGLQLNLPNTLQHGFIAQELEKIYPELVSDLIHPVFNEKNIQTGTRTLKGVNYIGLISVLTSAVKELNEEVNVLKEKIESSAARPLLLSNTLTKNQLDELAENSYSMEQNVPNPFTDRSEIVFNLPKGIESGSIIVFDMTGKMIKEYKLNENKGKVLVNANEVGKGLFLYSLVIDNQEIITKKMIIK